MTVGELIKLLNEFPSNLQVYFCPDADGKRAMSPVDATLNMVHRGRGEVMNDEDPYSTVPPGFGDALVIYPKVVRDPA
jgi:hypothetical protein